MSQEHPSQPNPDPSEAQGSPPVEATFEVVDEIADNATVLQVESTSEIEPEIEPERQPASPPVSSPPARSPKVESQTLQKLQQFWQVALPKLQAGASTAYKGTIYAWGILRTGGQKFWAWWNQVLPQIRGLLPASLQTQLPDAVLTGAIAAILILLVWITPSLFFSKPSAKVVTRPPSPAPTLPPSTPTPEQPPIAQIQDQVAEVSNQYANGLIQSVQANFRASRLTVNISNGWYELTETQQSKLANDILKRAQQLNFMKLELTDSQGTLLARSPVVGPEMVILRATKPPTASDEMAG